jgi:hypothetical protein
LAKPGFAGWVGELCFQKIFAASPCEAGHSHTTAAAPPCSSGHFALPEAGKSPKRIVMDSFSISSRHIPPNL